uniref:Aladin seven-bladed propeller domain-containing protein n=1 Tax=Kalanchoe fedtschenkoi TaxID=63787 RepID=A0A7N0TKV6_KALFE
MPSFPHPGSVTVCEINRDLIVADSLSDDRAKEAYGKILGMVFSPVQFQADQFLVEEPASEIIERKSLLDAIGNTLKRFFHPNDEKFLPEVDLHRISWHQHKHILAFVSGSHQVAIHDYEDSDGKETSILVNDFQRHVKVIEWRPNGGKTLAVACKGGICIWAASYLGNTASVRSGVSSFLGSPSRGSGTRWTLIDFLRSPSDEHISALAWSPNGIYLASASYESSSFTIWDVAQGIGTPIRRGLGGISVIKWSPTGDYFLSAKFDGTFYLWETNTWTSEPWSSTGGFVTGAMWGPDGHMILIAFSESATLGSIHFASKPPSLDAHLLPLELPEIPSLTGSQKIEKIAWDASGERLAVSYRGGDELYKGLIAIYDARRTPLVSVSLVGFIRGPGDNPKPLAISFHNKFKEAPLLSVCWSSGFCCTYPLIFRSNVLP